MWMETFSRKSYIWEHPHVWMKTTCVCAPFSLKNSHFHTVDTCVDIP